jgi:4-amino-4-deoxy-L-arabinose transferase-like glycosyltransferase/membrane-associated phospholipid phosphatase
LVGACGVAAIAFAPFDVGLSEAARTWSGPARAPMDELVGVMRAFGWGHVAVLLALVVAACGRRREALQALLALALVGLVVTAVKWGVARPRPNHAYGWAFPSGDAATVAALTAPFLAWRPLLAAPLLALIATVAYGRMHQGYHYPADVCTGVLVGAACSLGAAFIVARWRWLPSARACLVLAALFVLGAIALEPWWREHHHGAAGDIPSFLLVFGPAIAALVAARWLRCGMRKHHRFPQWLAPTAIALGAAALSLWLATRSTLWDRDEPRFARASVEMAASGEWLVPTYDGQWRLHKPVGIYWLMAPPLAWFHQAEWAARLPAALAAGAIALLAWWIGRRLASPAAGAWAAVVVATSPLLLVCGSAATTDAVLVAFIAAALALVARELILPDGLARERLRPSALATVALGTAMGAALLVKGPLGLIVPVAAVVVAWLLSRGRTVFGALFWARFAVACLLALGLFLAWAIPANARTVSSEFPDGAYLAIGLGKHVIQRGQGAMEGHGGGPWYYLPIIVGAFFPWTALLPAGFAALWRSGAARALIIAWLLPTFLILSFYATKLPHYILPIFPALALAVALALTAQVDARHRQLLRIGAWILLACGLLVAVALALLPWLRALPADAFGERAGKSLGPLQRLDGLTAPLLAIAAAFAALAVAGSRQLIRGRAPAAAMAMATGMVAVVFAAGLAMPAIERWKPSKPMALAIRAATPSDEPVRVLDYDEPSLHYYLDRGPIAIVDGVAGARAWAAEPGTGVLVLTREALAEAGDLGAREIASASGINLANGRWCDLVAIEKGR